MGGRKAAEPTSTASTGTTVRAVAEAAEGDPEFARVVDEVEAKAADGTYSSNAL